MSETPRTDAFDRAVQDEDIQRISRLSGYERMREHARTLERELNARCGEAVERWVAVSERMPAAYETILLVDGDGIKSTGFWNGNDFAMDLDHEVDPRLTPTHWMPLPAAPSDKEESK